MYTLYYLFILFVIYVFCTSLYMHVNTWRKAGLIRSIFSGLWLHVAGDRNPYFVETW
jgi:hypothetical protein